jgi:hypothetical protein
VAALDARAGQDGRTALSRLRLLGDGHRREQAQRGHSGQHSSPQ